MPSTPAALRSRGRVTLYTLVCGAPPFRDKNEIRLLRLFANLQFLPVKEKAPSVPDAWAALIHGLLEPDLGLRIKSASEVVARLDALDVRADRKSVV